MTRRIKLILLAIVLLIIWAMYAVMPIARADCSGYIVQRGDTLYRIALANGTTWQELATLNGLTSPDKIYVGQCLMLKAGQVVSASSALKGLAMADPSHSEDLTTLNILFWYTWGENCNGQSNCINMVRTMRTPAFCYDTLLVGNEPNAIEPYGMPISPNDAVSLVLAIHSACPNTKLIVGNVSADDWSGAGGWGSGYNWLKKFLSEYRKLTHRRYVGGLGVHCYQTQPSWCIVRLKEMRSLYSGEMWLTEYNDLSGDLAAFTALTDYAFANFSRVALYTNRQPDAPWALAGASVVRDDGTLDERGALYAQR